MPNRTFSADMLSGSLSRSRIGEPEPVHLTSWYPHRRVAKFEVRVYSLTMPKATTLFVRLGRNADANGVASEERDCPGGRVFSTCQDARPPWCSM